MSGLLINEPPLMFQPSLACRVGINEAIFLQQLHYWLGVNQKQKRNLIDGRYWVYNTLSQWLEQFPFWSESTLRRTIKSLKEQGVLLVDFFGKEKRDRTAWYSIDYSQLATESTNASVQNEHIPSVQNEHMEAVKMNRSSIQKTNYTETTTETNEEPPALAALPPTAENGNGVSSKFEQFREIYNQHRPRFWPEMQVINPKRQRLIKELIRDCGGTDSAIVALTNALKYAQGDSWYSSKSLNFENFASNGKILQLHERFIGQFDSGIPPTLDTAANRQTFTEAERLKKVLEAKYGTN